MTGGTSPAKGKSRLRKILCKILGMERTPGRFWGFRFKFRFFVFAFFGLIVLPLLGGATVYSTHPAFCRSCHIMEPYYKAWEDSHHKDVATCVDCHYPPGSPRTIVWKKFQALSQVAKYVTRTYSSKPFAEIEDASCLRSGCHSTRLLQGKVVSEKGVVFDHKPHLEGVRYGRQLRCVSCHSQIVVGKHIEVTWDTCYLCHLKGRKQGRHIEVLGGCLGCHAMPSQPIKVGNITYSHAQFLSQHQVACENCHQDTIQGEGEVSQERCTTCHNEPAKLNRFAETDFLHANHVTKHNTACLHCHKEIRHRAAPAGTKELNLDCSVCHSNMHNIQKNIYMGTGAKGVPPMPSPMYLANVDCVGCHVESKSDAVTEEETRLGSEKGCTMCHGEEYTGILVEAQGIIEKTRNEVESRVAVLKKQLAETRAEISPEVSKDLAHADANLRFLELSHPIHNVYYAAQILKYTEEKSAEIATEFGIGLNDISQDAIISGNFCATLCHSKVGVKVPPETVTYRNATMPHQEHIEQDLTCAYCHVFGTHKDVRLKSAEVCAECHEEEKK